VGTDRLINIYIIIYILYIYIGVGDHIQGTDRQGGREGASDEKQAPSTNPTF